MKLRFHENIIKRIAARYEYLRNEDEVISLKEQIQKQGFINKEQLKLVAYWKAPRSAGHVGKNEDGYIQDITSFALSSKNERSRIEVLTILDGVSWPTASVLLHLYHSDPYPILDFRALWSAGLEVPKLYNFEFWLPYVFFCRGIAHRNNVSMRDLDRSMWQYSKENQKTLDV